MRFLRVWLPSLHLASTSPPPPHFTRNPAYLTPPPPSVKLNLDFVSRNLLLTKLTSHQSFVKTRPTVVGYVCNCNYGIEAKRIHRPWAFKRDVLLLSFRVLHYLLRRGETCTWKSLSYSGRTYFRPHPDHCALFGKVESEAYHTYDA